MCICIHVHICTFIEKIGTPPEIEANGEEEKAQWKGSQASPTCLDLTAPAVGPAAPAVTQRSPNG